MTAREPARASCARRGGGRRAAGPPRARAACGRGRRAAGTRRGARRPRPGARRPLVVATPRREHASAAGDDAAEPVAVERSARAASRRCAVRRRPRARRGRAPRARRRRGRGRLDDADLVEARAQAVEVARAPPPGGRPRARGSRAPSGTSLARTGCRPRPYERAPPRGVTAPTLSSPCDAAMSPPTHRSMASTCSCGDELIDVAVGARCVAPPPRPPSGTPLKLGEVERGCEPGPARRQAPAPPQACPSRPRCPSSSRSTNARYSPSAESGAISTGSDGSTERARARARGRGAASASDSRRKRARNPRSHTPARRRPGARRAPSRPRVGRARQASAQSPEWIATSRAPPTPSSSLSGRPSPRRPRLSRRDRVQLLRQQRRRVRGEQGPRRDRGEPPLDGAGECDACALVARSRERVAGEERAPSEDVVVTGVKRTASRQLRRDVGGAAAERRLHRLLEGGGGRLVGRVRAARPVRRTLLRGRRGVAARRSCTSRVSEGRRAARAPAASSAWSKRIAPTATATTPSSSAGASAVQGSSGAMVAASVSMLGRARWLQTASAWRSCAAAARAGRPRAARGRAAARRARRERARARGTGCRR